MKPVFAPDYYPQFACITSACRHSCCVGWEIDLDEKTATRYQAAKGDLGDRLRAGVDFTADPPCMILTPDERCPFLCENGLCDVICHLGEEALCHICADHPRFRHVTDDRVELGLGLCCEAAAALILSRTEPFRLIELPPDLAARDRFSKEEAYAPDEDTLALRERREALLALATDRSMPLATRMNTLMDLDGAPSARPLAAWADTLRSLERLDTAWDACIDALADHKDEAFEDSIPYEQLLSYFLYRYAADEDAVAHSLAVPVRFAVLSTRLIYAITRATGKALADVSRMYSSEIEYSEDNLACVLSLLS